MGAQLVEWLRGRARTSCGLVDSCTVNSTTSGIRRATLQYVRSCVEESSPTDENPEAFLREVLRGAGEGTGDYAISREAPQGALATFKSSKVGLSDDLALAPRVEILLPESAAHFLKNIKPHCDGFDIIVE